jgi:SAM-dependent methyltransferase
MRVHYQQLLRDPIDFSELDYIGHYSHDRSWTKGTLASVRRGSRYPVKDGIPNFVPEPKATWTAGDNVRDATILDDTRQIGRNWSDQLEKANKNEGHYFYNTLREIARAKGLVLDVASGPGGGCVPPLLLYSPSVCVMMSDLGIRVVERWQEFLRQAGHYPNMGFIGLDATRMPFKSESFDFVVDSGGFGNVDGSDLALSEASRVLKIGGMLFLNDAETEGLDGFPTDVRREWADRFPHTRVGWERLVEGAGLEIVERKTYGTREVRPDESDLGRLAAKYDTGITFRGQSIRALKT